MNIFDEMLNDIITIADRNVFLIITCIHRHVFTIKCRRSVHFGFYNTPKKEIKKKCFFLFQFNTYLIKNQVYLK